VLIDDVFPVDALQMVAYLKPARRQLWGPLIEKAAAKLHASYEALSGGTFAEAFSMLTGFPVQRILLPSHPAMREPKPLPADAGEGDRVSHAKAVERWRAKCIDSEELFAQLYSFRQSEYPIGDSSLPVLPPVAQPPGALPRYRLPSCRLPGCRRPHCQHPHCCDPHSRRPQCCRRRFCP
jgi:hypothetical protein